MTTFIVLTVNAHAPAVSLGNLLWKTILKVIDL
jgi:hypothetical protein